MASKLHLKDNPTLADLQQYVSDLMVERGFNDSLPHHFMMLIEECGELAKASRKEVGLKFAQDTKHADPAEEAADVLIILLSICNNLGIDVEKAFREKEERNKQRSWK